MNDEIIIERIEIIQGGLIQIDFLNTETNEKYRAFAESEKFFTMLGKAMQVNYEQWRKSNL